MQTILSDILRAVLRTPDSRQAEGLGSCPFLIALLISPVSIFIEKSLQITLSIQGERGRLGKTSMIIVQQPIFNSFSWLWKSSTVLFSSTMKWTGFTHGSLGSRYINRRQIKKSLSMTTFNLQYNPKCLFHPQSLRLVMVCHFCQITTRFTPITFKFITEVATDSGYQGRTFGSSWSESQSILSHDLYF